MGIYICPVCAEKLDISGKSYLCSKGHCFDIARCGYVNLLMSRGGGTVHGDNKLMVQARRRFLERGYYQPLREAVCSTALRCAPGGGIILDAGCGEGYYTSGIKAIFDRSEIAVEMYGVDISKTAVEYASKREKSVSFAAASVFDLPVKAESCDMLLTMFAPYCAEEFLRVLKKGGMMIMVIPSENHLWELKQAIYDTPYKNEVRQYELDGFDFEGSERVNFCMDISDPEDIQSLFSMTPYYYKTGKKEQERLNALTSISVSADFEIITYRKK